ncbi:MAG: extracellular solute-binding protein [Acidimicrobiales bacterium]|nr:extracellular solute-binding protein [Acidimicrobiales bacterium]
MADAHRRRVAAGWLAMAVGAAAVAACGGDADGTPTLTWYINPDNGGQATLASQCSDASGGAFRISTQILPNEADAQREQLVRRLAAKDSSIDLMSLDPPFVAEFANAGYLRPITEDADVAAFTDGVLDAPLETATWDGELVAPPFWANTQLLWYRRSVAEAAGVDPTADTFTWEQLIAAAEGDGKRVGVQGRRYEGYMVWINALVSSAGGTIIDDPAAGADARPAIDAPAGQAAARVVSRLARSSAAPADLATAGEEEARSTFQGPDGAFMVNWPYVYAAAQESVASGAIPQSTFDDIGWARYPRVEADRPSAPPLGGINLAIGNFTEHPQEALAALRCLLSVEAGVQYMVESGNPAARAAVYDDPAVREAYPMAELIRDSIASAAPRPITPYYGDVSQSVQRSWHPARDVDPQRTPADSASFMSKVLAGKRLL